MRRAVGLDRQVADALHQSPALTLTPTTGGDWDLRAGSLVGVVQTGDVEVRIAPKVAVRRLLFLLAFAADQRGWKDLDASFEEAEDVVSGIAMGFAHHAERALRGGVQQGYVVVEDALSTVRGRLREADQLRRRFGLPLPVEVTFDDFTVDIAENRLLLSAARRLLLLADLPVTARRRLLRLTTLLEGVTELVPGQSLPDLRLTRLNERYRNALTLARLVLQSSSLDADVGPRASVGFLFDMNRVFEDFLSVTLTAELERLGGKVRRQYTDVLDHAARVDIRPDLTWWSGSTCLAVVDAKYRAVAVTEMPHAHAHQMLAYCTALGLDTGWLVYAAGDQESFTHVVRNAGIRIVTSVVDLDQPPPELLGSIRRLAHHVSSTAPVPILV